MRVAGIPRALIVYRSGKQDIPATLGDGSPFGVQVDYQRVDETRGPTETIDLAYSFTRSNTVALGFPDVLFGPEDAFRALLARLEATGSDVVLGLFPTDGGRGLDRVHANSRGTVEIMELMPRTDSAYETWCLAVWGPRFTEFLHRQFNVTREAQSPGADAVDGLSADAASLPEMTVGRSFQAAIAAGLRVEAERWPDAWFLDVGSPDGLAAARRRLVDG